MGVRKKRDQKAAAMVKALAQYGVREESICVALKEAGLESLSKNTMHNLYRAELDEGRALGDAALLQTAFKQAQGGNTTMLIFLLKTRLGMKETVKQELTGADGEPLNPGVTLTIVRPPKREKAGGND